MSVNSLRSARIFWLGVGPLILAGCSGEEIAVEDGSAPSAAVVTPIEEPLGDMTPPEFDGLASVELIGQNTWRLVWEPARDSETVAGTIEYQVLHIAEPWRQPTADDDPIGASLPGATDLELTLEAPAGRFFVRAVDSAGNTSSWGDGLEQRSSRPWLRAPDGGPVAELLDCAGTEPGRGICVGSNGFAAIWDRGQWIGLSATEGIDLRLAITAAGTWLYSAIGHLYALAEGNTLVARTVQFVQQPQLPLVQFDRDHVELSYWVDSAGTLFIGADAVYRPVNYALGLPDPTTCGPIRGLGFQPAALFAFCSSGSVYSVSTAQPELAWLPLTANTEVSWTEGVRAVLATDDASAVVSTVDGVRRVGVGGWTPLVVANQPVGAPATPSTPALVPTRVGRAQRIGEQLFVPTDLGVFVDTPSGFALVPGSAGDAVGVLAPSPLEPTDQLTVVYGDGSVGRVRRGSRAWAVEPPMSGFTLAGRASDGTLLAGTRGAVSGVWALTSGRWRPIAPSLPEPELGVFVATQLTGAGATVYVAGSLDDRGVIFEGPAWSSALPLYPPPPSPEDVVAPGEVMTFDDTTPVAPVATPPLRGVPAEALPIPGAPMAPIVALDAHSDGRAVAVSSGQVWWRIAGGWLLLTERPGANIRNVTLDAGESYVLHEGDRLVRCWRDVCEADVPQPAGSPAPAIASWRGTDGLEVMTADGAVWRFARGQVADGARAPYSLEQTEAGTWSAVSPAQNLPSSMQPIQRLTGDRFDVLWTRDGALSELVDGGWLAQTRADDALAVVEIGGSWAALTSGGLIRLGEVPTVRRPEAPTP